MKKLHSEDVGGGRVEHWYVHDTADGKRAITVQTVQDVEPILDQNKREYADAPERFGTKQAFHKVASIPAVVIEEACRIHNISFRELMATETDKAKSIWRQLLNARELRYFRTRPGKVDVK